MLRLTHRQDEDQLVGRSNAAMYGRILRQGCRSIELDCWNGEDGEPVVTHGFTLCTRVKFAACIEEISSSAFATSSLPVAPPRTRRRPQGPMPSHLHSSRSCPSRPHPNRVSQISLSLEMHCSLEQQARVAEILRTVLGERLLLPVHERRWRGVAHAPHHRQG